MTSLHCDEDTLNTIDYSGEIIAVAELHVDNMNKSIIDQSEIYTEWDYHKDSFGDFFVFFSAKKDCEGKVYDAKYLISMYPNAENDYAVKMYDKYGINEDD